MHTNSWAAKFPPRSDPDARIRFVRSLFKLRPRTSVSEGSDEGEEDTSNRAVSTNTSNEAVIEQHTVLAGPCNYSPTAEVTKTRTAQVTINSTCEAGVNSAPSASKNRGCAVVAVESTRRLRTKMVLKKDRVLSQASREKKHELLGVNLSPGGNQHKQDPAPVRYDLAFLVRDDRWHTVIRNGVERRERKPSPSIDIARERRKTCRMKATTPQKRKKTSLRVAGGRVQSTTPEEMKTVSSSTAGRGDHTDSTVGDAAPVNVADAKSTRTAQTVRARATRRSLFDDSLWPYRVAHLLHVFNPENVQFEFEEPFLNSCGCVKPCRKDTCPNGILGVFCTRSCCDHDVECGNRLKDHANALIHFDEARAEYEVVADGPIEKGVVIGEYTGVLMTRRKSNKRQPKRNNGYMFKIKRESISHPRADVYIDAEKSGGLTRFLNHSCSPNALFHEVRNGSTHTVVAVAEKVIPRGVEITVSYGSELWFICRCGHQNCMHRDIQHLDNP